MKIQSVHSVITQMNSDLAEGLLPPNVARKITNARPDTAGDTGFIQNIQSNVIVENEDLPAGVNTVIGATRYYKEKSIIYFVHNSNGHDSIWMYNIDDGTITRVLQQDYPAEANWETDLNFSLEYPITHANVIGDILFWVDKLNYPGKVNLAEGMLPSVITLQDIRNYNIPPPLPVVLYGTDRTIEQNNLRGRAFQFAVRYIYNDDTYSVLSPYSASPIPANDFTYSGDVVRDRLRNNYIEVTVPLGNDSVIIVEIYAREGNYGNWGIVNSINKEEKGLTGDDVFIYKFYNNVAPFPVDQKEASRTFDSVPDAASSQEFIDDKYLVYGYCLEGRENIDVDVSLGVELVELSLYPEVYSPDGDLSYEYSLGDGWIDGLLAGPTVMSVAIPESGIDNRVAGDVLFVTIGVTTFTLEVTQDMVDDIGVYIKGIRDFVNDKFSDLSIVANDFPSSVTLISFSGKAYYVLFALFKEADVESLDDFISIHPLPKMGAVYKFGIVYYDELMRPHTIQRNDDCVVNIPYFTDNPNELKHNHGYRINWGISHDPPSWAKYYRWAFSSNRPLNYVQYVVGDGGVEFVTGETYVLVDIEPLLRITDPTFDSIPDQQFSFPGSIVSYQYEVGDRLRFITEEYDSSESGVNFPPDLITVGTDGGVLDLEVLGFYIDDDGNQTNKLMVQGFNPATANVGTGSLFEIYRPQKEFVDDIYYELPELYPIEEDGVTGNLVHKDFSEGGTFVPSIGSLYGGGIIAGIDTVNRELLIISTDYTSSPFTQWALAEEITEAFISGGFSDWRLPTQTELATINTGLYASYNELAGIEDGYHWTSEDVGSDAYASRMDVFTLELKSKGDSCYYRPVRTAKYGVANGIFTKLDNYFVYRGMSKKFQAGAVTGASELWVVESASYSDFYKSDVYNLGRMNIYDARANRAWRNLVRRSDEFFFESRLNGLSSFKGENFEVFSPHFGEITGMAQIGFTLSVIQEHKVTSVYIGRAGLMQAEQGGQQVMAITDNVFGTSYRSEDEYGCQHPESIIKVNRYLYYYDMANQAIIRKAANGNIDISRYGIKKDIIEMSQKLKGLETDEAWVVSGYDALNDEVLFSFVFDSYESGVDAESYTYVFAENPALGEDSNRWKALYTLDNAAGKGVDCFSDFGNTFIAFMDGGIWLMNEGVDRLSLFGIQREASIELIINKEFGSNKKFRSIAVASNDNWEASDYDDIVIPSVDLNKIDGKSRLLGDSFKLDRDGKRWAAFKQNAMTRSSTPSQADLFRGKDLQGRLMRLRLRNDSSEPVYLQAVIVNCQIIK